MTNTGDGSNRIVLAFQKPINTKSPTTDCRIWAFENEEDMLLAFEKAVDLLGKHYTESEECSEMTNTELTGIVLK